jgi:leucyl aminopeptidase
VPVAEGAVKAALAKLGARVSRVLGRRVRDCEFRGRPDEVLTHHGDSTIVLLGLGAAPGVDAFRRAGARGRQEAERARARRVQAWLGDAARNGDVAAAFCEGFVLAGYRFRRYTSGPASRAQSLAVRTEAASPGFGDALEYVQAAVTEVFRARDLVNEPPSVATPRYLAAQAEALSREIKGLEVDAWEPKRLVREQLNGILAVSRGSREEPRLITVRWAPPGARRKVALVGKAVTFDSGGLSLKPPKSMETMKYDMAGGAAVMGAVAAAARLELPVEVTAYVPATENLPGGLAQKPGDVIRYANGRTVEVLNTDAEGRLILADALILASRTRPDAIVDLATLTGACRVALGPLFAAVMGNQQALVDALVEAGKRAGENLWQLPLVPEYREDLKSPIADLKNVGGEAGSIIGGLFLQSFVDGVPWAHLDIAGPAFTEKDLPQAPRGGTGFGVRLLLRYLAGA